MTKLKVMGLDPSSKFGIAIAEAGGSVIFTQEVEFKKLAGFERCTALVSRVIELKKEFNPDLVVVEGMFVGHPSSAIPIIQLGSILRYFFWQEAFPLLEVGPTVLKKFVVGKGNAIKEQMMMGVLKRWGFESPTNNIADAVGLAMAGLCAINCPGFTLEDRKIIGAVTKEADEITLAHIEHLGK